MIRGTLAAATTPLRDAGEALDGDAIEPVVAFLRSGGLDGVMVLGTTGEGILLRGDERRRAAERFVSAARAAPATANTPAMPAVPPGPSRHSAPAEPAGPAQVPFR